MFSLQQTNIQVPATSSIYRRINYIALAIILALVIGNIWLSAIFSGKSILTQQSIIMAQTLVKQASSVARHHVSETSYTVLQQIVDDLASSEYIYDAVVYDYQGKVLAQSAGHNRVIERLTNLSNDELEQVTQLMTPFVEEIYDNESRLIGYVSINFLQQDILTRSSEYQSNIWKQLIVMLVLAFVMGILGSRAFAKLRYRKTKAITRS